jgi:hypothetical protein
VAEAYRSLLEALRDHTSIKNVSTCFPYKFGFPWPPIATQRFATGQYRLYKCSNINACVVCGGKNAGSVQKQLNLCLDSRIKEGASIWLMTLELGFDECLPAKKRYRTISRLFGKVLNQSGVKRLRNEWEIPYFKALEEVLIDQIWTPHFHLVWVFPPGIPGEVISEFMDLISVKWRFLASKEPFLSPHRRAVWAQELDHKDGGVSRISRYFTKSFYWEISQDKAGDNPRTPMDYAIRFAFTADLDALEVWNAYEEASNGAHRFKFSRNWNFSC